MRSLLVTGGAGFIGANFVHYWLGRHPGDRVVVLDALTYAGNLASLAPLRDRAELSFVAGRHPHARTGRRAAAGARITTVVHFAAESHVDRSIHGPDAFIETNVRGTHELLKAARAVWLDEGPARTDVRFHHVSTDEVYGSLGPDDPAFTETLALRAQLAVRGEQGRVGSPGPRLPSHLRPAGHHEQLLQQLRALSVPREADPAHAGERARGEAAAGVRRRAQRAGLAVRGGSLPGDRARAPARAGGRDLQRRRAERVAQHRHRRLPLPAGGRGLRGGRPRWRPASRAARPRPGGETASLDHLRPRPARDTTAATRSTRARSSDELGFGPSESFESGHAEDAGTGTWRTRRGGGASWTAAIASGSVSTTPRRQARS